MLLLCSSETFITFKTMQVDYYSFLQVVFTTKHLFVVMMLRILNTRACTVVVANELFKSLTRQNNIIFSVSFSMFFNSESLKQTELKHHISPLTDYNG